VHGKGTDAQGVCKVVEIVNGRFAARKDDDLATGSECALGKGLGIGLFHVFGNVVGMPGAGGVAPRAFNGTALQAYEIGGLAEMATFPLPSVKSLVDGKEVHGT